MASEGDGGFFLVLTALLLAVQIHIDNVNVLLQPIVSLQSRLRRHNRFSSTYSIPLLVSLTYLHMKGHLMQILTQRGVHDAISPFYVEPRSLHWWNHYVEFTRVNDARFIELFHLPITIFQDLCNLLHDQLKQGDIPVPLASISDRLITVEKQVAIAVLRLASGTRIVELSEHFGMGKSTIVKIINKFFDALLVHRAQFISFPQSGESLVAIKAGFEEKQGLPNCCGALDVTHTMMDKPANEAAVDWRDRNCNYSMSLQAVVDSSMRFLDVFAGWPGSTNDARLLRNSSFFHCVRRHIYLAGPPLSIGEYMFREFIVADGGYGLHPWLMVPYDAPRTMCKKDFNFKLSSTRIIVERAFGRLKTKWQYLNKKISNPRPKNVAKAIVAACILHNMLLSVPGSNEDDPCIEHRPLRPPSRPPPIAHTAREAKKARDDLARYLARL